MQRFLGLYFWDDVEGQVLGAIPDLDRTTSLQSSTGSIIKCRHVGKI
jgi:hypothetical protein